MFHVSIVREDLGGCNILTDKVFGFLSPMDIFLHAINIPNERFIYKEQLLTQLKSYPLGEKHEVLVE